MDVVLFLIYIIICLLKIINYILSSKVWFGTQTFFDELFEFYGALQTFFNQETIVYNEYFHAALLADSYVDGLGEGLMSREQAPIS